VSSKKDSELPAKPQSGFSRRGFIGRVGLGGGALGTGLLENEAIAAPPAVAGPGAVPNARWGWIGWATGVTASLTGTFFGFGV